MHHYYYHLQIQHPEHVGLALVDAHKGTADVKMVLEKFVGATLI